MQTNLTVTFYKKDEARNYTLNIDADDVFVNIVATRTEPEMPERSTDETYLVRFYIEEFHNWIRHDPMFHPGGLYGVLKFCVEHYKLPPWLKHFEGIIV